MSTRLDTSTTALPPAVGAVHDLTGGTLPRWAALAAYGGAVVLAVAVSLLLGWGLVAIIVLAWLFGSVALVIASRRVEGTRRSTDRLATVAVSSAFALAMLPLFTLVFEVVSKGAPQLSAEFFTFSMRNVVGEGGGIYHAILGTLLVTGAAAVMSVPVGIMTAVYLVEYGHGRLARTITLLVDVMTGIPSIVAGLFAIALFTILFGAGTRSGFAGSVALAVLMVPIVVRSTEEMLKLVPNELREASYALGVSRWRTIVKVVLPTSVAGIVTGVTLAIARVIGETAPLILTAGFTDSTNLNLFGGRMMTLPVFTYSSFKNPGVPPEFGIERAWGAALVLMMIVMLLNLLARLVSRYFSPKSR